MADQSVEMKSAYDGVAKTLHWVVALLMIVMLTFGWTLEDLPLDEKVQTLVIHSSLGLSVFLLMAVRLYWRYTHTPPSLPDHMPSWQVTASKASHRALYFFAMLQPLLGLAQSAFADFAVRPFAMFTVTLGADKNLHGIFHQLHAICALILIALVLLHLGAALYHHFGQKDTVLRRMLPFGQT
ncbi:MAG: cytochrome b [Rhodobiaceae bacterium]|nr:MAG: cytochrome b [Rhodobiaceae bacterium]